MAVMPYKIRLILSFAAKPQVRAQILKDACMPCEQNSSLSGCGGVKQFFNTPGLGVAGDVWLGGLCADVGGHRGRPGAKSTPLGGSGFCIPGFKQAQCSGPLD